MKTAEFEKFFNSLKNKNFKHSNKVNNLDEISNYLNVALNNFSNNVKGEGVYKECTYMGDKSQYELLKVRENFFKKCTKQCRVNDDMIKFNHWLINHGIKTPKLHTIFYADSKYYELFDRVRGGELFSDKIVFDKVLPNHDKTKQLTSAEFTKYRNAMFRYVIGRQKILLSYDKQKYKDLFNQYKMLWNYGIRDFDINSGNIMLGKDGFSIIDLSLQQNLTKILKSLEKAEHKKYTVDKLIAKLDKESAIPPLEVYHNLKALDNEIIIEVVSAMSALGTFGVKELSREQTKKVWHNNKKIFSTLVEAITDLDYSIIDYSSGCEYTEVMYDIKSAVGHNEDSLSQILKQQYELKKSKDIKKR